MHCHIVYIDIQMSSYSAHTIGGKVGTTTIYPPWKYHGNGSLVENKWNARIPVRLMVASKTLRQNIADFIRGNYANIESYIFYLYVSGINQNVLYMF